MWAFDLYNTTKFQIVKGGRICQEIAKSRINSFYGRAHSQGALLYVLYGRDSETCGLVLPNNSLFSPRSLVSMAPR